MSPLHFAGPTPWTDAKRHLWLLSPGLPLMACLSLAGFAWRPAVAWCWVIPLLLFVVVPLLDAWIGNDSSNPPPAAVGPLESDRHYLHLVLASIPLQWLVTVLGAWCATQLSSSPAAWWGLVITVGAVNGLGINVGHELGHKHSRLLRRLAVLALAPSAYGHFRVEHNEGHHRHVATPQDPASSRMGESFWQFLPRTVLGGLASAWSIESARLARNGQRRWSWHNRNLRAWSASALLFSALVAAFGLAMLPFALAQALYAVTLLEVVNYLEHYGLLRQTGEDGRFERCSPAHSWNSNSLVGNLLLYQLQRHSDHHANPARAYQALRHFDSSPQLPAGYATMLMLAYVPPLWFAVMDKRLVAHCQGDLRRANVDARAGPRLRRAFGQT